MAKKHLKRVAAPPTWMISRKESKFIAMPRGSYSLELGMPLIAVLKDVLNLVSTRKEGKRVLNSKEILVNGIRRKDEKFMIGLMDVLTVKEIGKSYRMLLNRNNVLVLAPVSDTEAAIKICKITGKRVVGKGSIQLSFHDGRSIMGSNEHRTGDSLVLEMPAGRIKHHLKLGKGCQAYLIGGSNVGRSGIVENISGDKVAIKIGDDVVEAARRFVLVTGSGSGSDKPVMKSVASVSV